MKSKYQTLSEFLLSPFHKKEDLSKDITYSSKYRQFVQSNKIRIYAICEIEDSYYYHIKIPSESQKNGKYEYDVVIRFFTDNPDVLNQNHQYVLTITPIYYFPKYHLDQKGQCIHQYIILLLFQNSF